MRGKSRRQWDEFEKRRGHQNADELPAIPQL
jgi:hypothetical protein